jgi:ion channel POLLUX/CASTOR
LLARNSNDIQFEGVDHRKNTPVIKVKPQLKVEEQEGIVKILILGWNHHIPALIRELCSYEEEQYHITIVAMYSKVERQRELERLENLTDRVKWELVESDYVRESELKKMNPSAFDNILLVSSDFIMEEEEADARTIVGYVLLEEMLENVRNKPHILLELSDPNNESLLRKYNSEVIISPLVLSNLLAGIALQREVNSIYKELFTAGGAEIIFRDPEEYEIAPGPISFQELENQAAEFGETALGIFKVNGDPRRDEDLILNPGRYKNLEIKQGVRLVVLTTVY